jgi:predicted GIY-YIG superfamily endonuclease
MPIAIRARPTHRPAHTKGRGMVYLLHFANRYHHAGHYVGYTEHLPARLDHHRAGTGARLLAAVSAAGIPFEVAFLWPNTSRAFERKLHNLKNTPVLCPACTKSDGRARGYSPRGVSAQNTSRIARHANLACS